MNSKAAEVTEFVCAAMWPLTMWVYGVDKASPGIAAGLGMLQYLVLITLGAFTSRPRPLLTGAHAGALLGLGRIGWVQWFRASAAQFAGSVAGTWLLERHGVDRHVYWDGMRELRPAFWGMFAVQALVVGACAALSIQLSDTPESEHPRKGAFWDMCRSGIWLVALCYPWGGPSGLVMAWRWIHILYGQPMGVTLAFSLAGALLQSSLAVLLVQVMQGRKRSVAQE
jgi:hypothetical protein